jgi:hypothetical protein
MKTIRIYLLILLVFCLGFTEVWAQKAVISAGANASGSGGSVSYSVGQIVYSTATGSTGTSNQGVQQPYEFFTVGVDENPGINLQLTVYPNPTPSQVTLNTGSLDPANMTCYLYDSRGILLNTQIIQRGLTIIPMENLVTGMYVLKVLDGQSLLRTFKIIKN